MEQEVILVLLGARGNLVSGPPFYAPGADLLYGRASLAASHESPLCEAPFFLVRGPSPPV